MPCRNGGAIPPLSRGKSSSSGSGKKIVIRPYQKPPQLPSNYYDEAAGSILKGCLAVLQSRIGTKPSNATVENSSSPLLEPSQQSLSLQNAYTATVHLVSHNFGARLYADVVLTLQEAAIWVLPEETAKAQLSTVSSNCSTKSDSLLLLPSYIVQQYQSFADFVLLLQHVCLPLDRTWQWQWLTLDHGAGSTEWTAEATTGNGGSTVQGRAIAMHSSSAVVHGNSTGPNATSTSTSAANSSPLLQTLWHVGLSVFLRRLSALKLDTILYQQWLAALLQDWNGNGFEGGTSNGGDGLSVRHCLQHVWYLWQDLRILGQLPLQRDLEQYWSGVSNDWKQRQGGVVITKSELYPLATFLQFCHAKLQHCHYWRPWLPVPWLWNILDVNLVQPHLNTDFLLSDTHLFPVLTEQLLAHKTESRQRLMDIGSYPHTSTKDSGRTKDALNPLQQLWILAGRLPGGQPLVSQAIQRYAREQGRQRVGVVASNGPNPTPSALSHASRKSPSSPSTNTAVEDLLMLQDCLSSMIEQLPGASVSHDPGTTNGAVVSLKSVWEEVVNIETTPSLAEQLAKLLDSTLRSNKKMEMLQTHSSSSFEFGWLQRIVSGLFIPLQAKDIFEAFYKRDLAKRLLWNRVVSAEAEKQVCSLLKAECGTGYTSKIEGMFQDVEWSREIMLVYKQSTARSVSISTVEVEVQVLTTGYWPVYPVYPNLLLPDYLKEQKDLFDTHYKNKYQGRRITWQYALGHCMVKANGFSKAYELLLSLCQAMVLVQFTTTESVYTLPQLLHITGLEDRGEMERILQSLSLGKDGTRILRKMDYDAEPGKKCKTRMNVDDRDKFVINSSFESNVRRVRINNIMMKETKEEHDKTVESVSRDRLYLIDAVLVRIMKARKTVLHQALIPQVLEQVKVPALASDVKKRIETLIEREYMERDTKDRHRYNYLA